MKRFYTALFCTLFLFSLSPATAQDDHEHQGLLARIEAIERLLDEQEEDIEKMRKTLIPVGSMIFTGSGTTPPGYLYCDGSALSRTEFSELFTAVGTTWGQGDGSTTFNIPDLRGDFIRVWSKGHSVDSGRRLGQAQGQSTAMPNTAFGTTANGGHGHSLAENGGHQHPRSSTAGNHQHTINGNGAHGHRLKTAESGACKDTVRRSRQIAGATVTETVPAPPNERCAVTSRPGARYGTLTGSRNNPPRNEEKNIITSVGNHSHGITANGNHHHTIPAVAHHGHTLGSEPNHNHNITGGDPETRPKNQALACYIRAFSHSAF